MRYRPLGRSGIEASIVGMGTWVTGGGAIWGEEPDDSESIRAIHAAIDAGVTLIDTAPAYGFGRSEEVVGKAIQGRRDQVVVATKCGLLVDDERGAFHFDYDGHKLYRSLRPDTIREELEGSLRRLQTDYIDLYQTHWPAMEPVKTPIADTMACLLALKDEGKIRAIGVSNVSLADLRENVEQGGIASDQFRYSLLFRDAETEILSYCKDNQVSTLTYMSLEQGLLTGKVGMDKVFTEGDFRTNTDWNPWYKRENRKKVLDLLAGWRELTDKYACNLAQLVVACTAEQPGVTHVLCGARNAEQITQTAAAGSLIMSEADVQRMRQEVLALGNPA